ncbi:hypothetical protein MMC30_001186 [Trapelia coarctata]|nr:hypothetical protein [Trapelia coarctata]
MAGWRDRKYVPDSDEEEEVLSVEETPEVGQAKEGKPSGVGFLDIDSIPSEGKDDGKQDDLPNLPLGQVSARNSQPEAEGPLEQQLDGHEEVHQSSQRIPQSMSYNEDSDIDELQLSQGPKLSSQRPRPQTTVRRVLDRSRYPNDEIDELQQDIREVSSPILPAGQLVTEQLCPVEADTSFRVPPGLESRVSSLDARISSSPSESPSVGHANLFPANSGSKLSRTHEGVTSYAPRLKQSTGPALRERGDESIGDYNPLLASKPTRSLRQRAPIQLRPYALEGEIYRQTLKARGMKPIRIDQEQAEEDGVFDLPETNNSPEKESQASSADTTTNIGSSSPCRASSLPTSEPSRPHSQVDEDEFPDVSTLLRTAPGAIIQGNKRRKVAHTFSRSSKRLGVAGLSPESVVADNSAHPNLGLSGTPQGLQDDPNSPLASTNLGHIPPSTSVFRYPPGMTPVQQITPAKSSEVKRPRIIDIDDESDFDDAVSQVPSDRRRGSETLATESSCESESESESEGENEIQAAQRKCRGTLPASYIRLDLNARYKTAALAKAVPRKSLSPIKDRPEKGVARLIPSHKYRAGSKAPSLPVEIPDDSSSDRDMDMEMDAGHYPLDTHETLRHRLVSPSLRDTVEVIEDNRIDFMLPPRPRSTKVQTRTKDHQSKLIGSGKIMKSKHKDTSLFRKRNDVKGRQPKISEHIFRRPKFPPTPLQRRLPQWGILDVTDSANMRAAPPFVRLAARTASSRAGKGKHSPSNKHLQLATREDTADAQEVLKTWKRGMIPHQRQGMDSANATPSTRTPLAACSGNNQRRKSAFYPTDEDRDRAETPSFKHRREDLSSTPKLSSNRQFTPLDELLGRHINTKKEQGAPPVRHVKRVKGRIASSLRTSAPSRPAMLELNRSLIASAKTSTIDDRQARVKDFLGSSRSSPAPLPLADTHGGRSDIIREGPSLPAATKRIQNRKRRPNKVDISGPGFRQDSPCNVTSDKVLATLEEVDYMCKSPSTLEGLGPFGTQYSTTFAITAFPPSVRLNRASFVGSGEFSRSLELTNTRDWDLQGNTATVGLGDVSFQWGPWNDTVSSQLGIAYDRLGRALRAPEVIQNGTASRLSNPSDTRSAVSIQRSIINYITNSLFFLDPVDRCPFIQRCIGLMSALNSDLSYQNLEPACKSSRIADGCRLQEMYIQISMQNLAMVYQISRLALHSSVPGTIKAELLTLLDQAARRTLSLCLGNGTGEILKFLRGCVAQFEPAEKIKGCDEAEAIVVVHHVLAHRSTPMIFWDEVNAILQRPQFEGVANVNVLDHQWQQMVSLLPLFDFDTHGTVRDRNGSSGEPLENWSLVKGLVQPVLHAYVENPRGQGPTFNAYFRTLLARCFNLVREWKWQRCESIVQAFFDFFASINLGHLRNEAAHGSPPFLEHLTPDLQLSVGREDRCFHIFLKLLGLGLSEMRNVYTNKRISGIVWRMMPNHDRHHPKEEAISLEDLDALRNHHDLLCVLYWASPSDVRPRLGVLRNLVHLENSHKEACHISIRAWSNLVNFQISTAEPVSNLEPFAEWCDDILAQIIRQHNLARSEVETQVRAAELSTRSAVAQDVLESTIAKNQRQIEAVLSDALVSLRKAIDAVSTAEQAQILLPRASLGQVFDLFDAKWPRVNVVIVKALDVILSLLKKIGAFGINEDSQDYGDLSGFADELGDLIPSKDHRLVQETLYRPLRRLLSNCFGADVPPEDALLLKMVQTWTGVAQLYVVEGAKTWDDYIGPYGQDCWDSLGDTEQTRKFTVAFLATLLEKNGNLYQSHKQLILRLWIASLVERESLLKFQSQLTAVIFNADRDNAILSNPPFWVDPKTKCFAISAADFRDRRLSLISSLLSNMRESLDYNIYHGLPEIFKLKNEYNELIKHLMATMKHNYQELGQGSSVRGVYVDFVQKVVEYLQQHTVEICAIDKFFLDPAAFPLPAKDPTYVVGRLKSYGLRLQDSKTAKQLSVFIQAVSERAVAEGQQKYLIEQLSTALSTNVETSDQSKPTLRAFSIQSIFPAYIELALRTSSGALLAMPILEALEEVLGNIMLDMDGFNTGCVAAIQTTIFALLGNLKESTQVIIDQPEKLEEPLILSLLCKYFDVLVAALPTVDYIARVQRDDQVAARLIAYFQDFARHITALLDEEEDVFMFLDNDEMPPTPIDKKLKATRDFTLAELKSTFQRNWNSHDGRTYVTKGKTRMEVKVNVGSVEKEKGRLKEHVEEFERVLVCMPWLGRPEEIHLPARKLPPELDDLVF